jgi:hypothetical protein
MYFADATLKFTAPYSMSRAHETPLLEKEGPDDFEKRTWREKAHFDSSGRIFAPPMAFKQALDRQAKYLGEKIAGARGATFTKHFSAGVMCIDPVYLTLPSGKPSTKDTLGVTKIHANSDGVRGGGKRLWRYFPEVEMGATCTVRFVVLDEVIRPDLLERYLREAGKFTGVGRFRPEKGGYYGRFDVTKFKSDQK